MNDIKCYFAWKSLCCYDRTQAHFIKWFLTFMTGKHHIVEKGYDEDMVAEYWISEMR